MIQWAVFAEHHKGLAPMWKPSVVSYWYMLVTAGLGIRDKRIARACSWSSKLDSVGKNKMVKQLKKLSWRQSLKSVSCFMGKCIVHTHMCTHADKHMQAHACAHTKGFLCHKEGILQKPIFYFLFIPNVSGPPKNMTAVFPRYCA